MGDKETSFGGGEKLYGGCNLCVWESSWQTSGKPLGDLRCA
jgi:hypothetical protein